MGYGIIRTMKNSLAASTNACSIVAVIAAFAIGVLHAAYNEVTTAFPMTGPTDFIAESGVTNVYTGIISGNGPAVIKGGGTVVFSNENNTYSGGTIVSNAVFRLDADGCAGVAAITGAVNTAHIFLNCENVPNDIRFLTGYTSTSLLAPGAYPAAGQYPLLPLQPEVTLFGEVSFGTHSTLFDAFSPATVNPTLVFMRGVSNPGYIRLGSYGTIIFKNRFVSEYSGSSHFGFRSSATGLVEFQCSSNVVRVLNLYNADLALYAKDALPNTLIYYEYSKPARAKIYLNGSEQGIEGFCFSTQPGSNYPAAATETSSGIALISSDNMTTVRITGSNKNILEISEYASWVNKIALKGKVSLVMDVDPSYTAAGFFQDFSARLSDTMGDLIISNGDFRVSDTASFPNVPNIYVGEGGTFTNASSKAGAFAGCRNLTVLGTMACTGDPTPFSDGTMAMTLGEGAKFSLPAGATVKVCSLKVGNTVLVDGTYGDEGVPVPQIERGTVILRRHDRYVDCVNGSDANDGAFGRPTQTIRAATLNAVSGDVIHVAPGMYGLLEGAQMVPPDSKVGTRVVVPEGVTLESTGGATNTFIVGAAATGDQIDDAEFGTGTNAVRCVYANAGATVRGFTLTGGRGVGASEDSGNGLGSAFYSAGGLMATIEDCIVSNNAAYQGTIYQAIVRRCRMFGNAAVAGSSGSAGYGCSWHNSIADRNIGNGTMAYAVAIENCTIGSENMMRNDEYVPHVVYWYGTTDHAIINSAILGGRYYHAGGGMLFCTNCLVMSSRIGAALKVEQSFNTIFTNSAAAMVDSEYRPVLGSFAGLDAGDAEYSTSSLGDTDILGTPRILNGAIDIGAVEYDWRSAFSGELGRRFRIEYASPSVTTNVTGGLLVPDGSIAGRVTSADEYSITFNVTDGIFAVYVGGEMVGESLGLGEQAIRFKVTNASDEVKLVFTPDAGGQGKAILENLSRVHGFSIIFR